MKETALQSGYIVGIRVSVPIDWDLIHKETEENKCHKEDEQGLPILTVVVYKAHVPSQRPIV